LNFDLAEYGTHITLPAASGISVDYSLVDAPKVASDNTWGGVAVNATVYQDERAF